MAGERASSHIAAASGRNAARMSGAEVQRVRSEVRAGASDTTHGERGWWAAAGLLALLGAGLLVAGLLLPSGQQVEVPEELTHGREMAARDALTFDADVLADVAAYRVPRRALALASRAIALGVPLLIGIVLLGRSRGAPRRRASGVLRVLGHDPHPSLQVGAATALVVLATAFVQLPVAVAAGVLQDGRWGFRTRSVPGWALDHLLVVTGRALLVGLLAAGVLTLVARYPRTWPARASVLVALIGPLVLLFHPLVVHPLLLPTGPLPDGEHRDAVVAVVARSGLDVPVLLGEASLRTTRRNAVVTGLGPTQRIVLHDTLLELGPREVAAITAHELAHLERRDPLRGTLVAVPLVLLIGLLVRRRVGDGADPRVAAGVVALVLAAEVALTPLSAALSRTVEHRTDVRSVALSGDPDAHVSLLRAFVVDGLADPEPPRWSVLAWATHPSPARRIRAVISASDDPSTDPSTGPSSGPASGPSPDPASGPSVPTGRHATR